MQSDADAKALVQRGYDRMAERYLAWAAPSPLRDHCVHMTCQRLPTRARVIELGCGAGIPVAHTLATQADLIGVDISATQIALARQNVPAATFLQADVMTVDFQPTSFDAVVSFFAITHLPRAEHAALFANIARWLKPQGIFTASLGALGDSGTVEQDWLGEPMFFSHFAADENRRLLRAAGFELLLDEVVAEAEDGVPVPFLWVIARKV